MPRLQDLNRRYPMALLPSHRSYIDPVVLASVLQRAGDPADVQARRHQRRVLADGTDGPPRRVDLHPAQLPRRSGLQARAAGVRRVAGGAPPEPRVVHRGRADAHRQAPRPAPRPARVPRRRGARRPLRRLPAATGLDRLRRAPRRGGARPLRDRCGQGSRVARPADQLRARPADPVLARRHPRVVRRSDLGARPPHPGAGGCGSTPATPMRCRCRSSRSKWRCGSTRSRPSRPRR